MQDSLVTKAADNVRILSAAMVQKAKSGHPGGAMGAADATTLLFAEFLRYDPTRTIRNGWAATASSWTRAT